MQTRTLTRDEWLVIRQTTLGGSEVVQMLKSPEHMHKLWMVKTGRAEPDDLSWVIPVQIGVETEALNLRMYEYTRYGQEHVGSVLTRKGHFIVGGQAEDWMSCTLDAFDPSIDAVVDAKHVNQFAKMVSDDPEKPGAVDQYWPQLYWNAGITGAETACLSVFIGTFKHQYMDVEIDPMKQFELQEAAREFWACVRDDIEPPDTIKVEAPEVDPSGWRQGVDLRTISARDVLEQNASIWIETKEAFDRHGSADKSIKDAIKADGHGDFGSGSGFGLKIKRAKNGSVKITPETPTDDGGTE